MKLLKKGSATKSDVYISTLNNKIVIIKSFKNKYWFIKYTYGWLVLNREYKILKRLKNIQGIPEIIDFNDFQLLETYIPGKSFATLYIEKKSLPASVFNIIYKIVDEIHKRRIVHLDLRLSSNYLLGDDGLPYILDFNTCLYIPHLPIIGNLILNLLKKIDYSGIIKMKYEFCPDAITEKEKILFQRISRFRLLWLFTPRGTDVVEKKECCH
ncbi:MAG: RIO1 family regulatory kinase/ATPase [Candidatus Hydrogenedentota bacterium]